MRMKLYGATGKGRLPTLGSLFDIKNHPKFDAALHQSRYQWYGGMRKSKQEEIKNVSNKRR